MKYLLLLLLLVSFNSLHAQKTFSSRQEAYNWLKETFEKKFTKTAVSQLSKNELGDEYYRENLYYDYTINDSSLIIFRSENTNTVFGVKYFNPAWIVIPFDKIDLVEPDADSKYYQAMSNITFRSNCRCYKKGEGRTIKDINKFTELINAITIPFNLIDGQNINQDIINAFKAVNPNFKTDAPKKDTVQKQQDTAQDNSLDTLAIANGIRKFAYTTLPQYDVYAPDSTPVNLADYLLKSRPYKDKPTLMVTFLYPFCRPCLIIIDSLLNSGVALHYNVILINRDGAGTSYAEMKNELASHKPGFNEDAILFYDPNNQLADLDVEQTPNFSWLDKDLNMVGGFTSYRIHISDITTILAKIEQGKITNGNVKYLDNYALPCEAKDAASKLTILNEGNAVKLSVYTIKTGTKEFEMNYIKNRKGKLVFQSFKTK